MLKTICFKLLLSLLLIAVFHPHPVAAQAEISPDHFDDAPAVKAPTLSAVKKRAPTERSRNAVSGQTSQTDLMSRKGRSESALKPAAKTVGNSASSTAQTLPVRKTSASRKKSQDTTSSMSRRQ